MRAGRPTPSDRPARVGLTAGREGSVRRRNVEILIAVDDGGLHKRLRLAFCLKGEGSPTGADDEHVEFESWASRWVASDDEVDCRALRVVALGIRQDGAGGLGELRGRQRAVAQAQTTSTAAARVKPSVILGVVGLARLGRLRRGAAGPAAPRGAFVREVARVSPEPWVKR